MDSNYQHLSLVIFEERGTLSERSVQFKLIEFTHRLAHSFAKTF